MPKNSDTLKTISGNVFLLSVMAVVGLTVVVMGLLQRQLVQIRQVASQALLTDEYEYKRSIINRTALDFRKYIVHQHNTPNSLISGCTRQPPVFDPWQTKSYNGASYAVSVCDNGDDAVYTSDSDELLWFKIDVTLPDKRQKTWYALLDAGGPVACDLSIITRLDQYAQDNSWTLTQGGITVASRTFVNAHDNTVQTDAVMLDIGVPYTFTYHDSYGDGFNFNHNYFRLRNVAAGVNIFNKSDATPPSNWFTCTANFTMDSTCTNPTGVSCFSPTPTPTPTPGPGTVIPTPTPGPITTSGCVGFSIASFWWCNVSYTITEDPVTGTQHTEVTGAGTSNLGTCGYGGGNISECGYSCTPLSGSGYQENWEFCGDSGSAGCGLASTSCH